MMNCDEIESRFGELLDGELPDELRSAVERHLHDCLACRDEYESLRSMVAALGRSPDAEPPAGLWAAIEERLDQTPSRSDASSKPAPRQTWIHQLARRPLAAAAVVALALGVGWLAMNAPWGSRALAAQIDFRPLLERVDGDIGAGIRALIQAYGGQQLSAEEAAEQMKIRVHAADTLPGELQLKARYLLNMGQHHQALAFHYATPGGDHLLMLQCPPHVEKDYGKYECLPCSVGSHQGRGVRVGKLFLMHMMSDNVCVCVVSTLDEHRELPAALDAVPIDF